MATTIYTYLHNDDLKGSRIVSMDDCMCKLYNIKREDSGFLKEFNSDLQKPALYILVNRESRKAYVGETDDFTKRIAQHLIKKDFWDEVLVFLGSNEDTLSKTEVQYLEFLAYNKALELKTYDLSENTQSPKQPHMNVMLKGKTDKFFRYVETLAQFVGCDIFTPKQKKAPKAEKHLFFCTRGGTNAQGYFVKETEEFVVLAGSEFRSGECDSLKPQSVEKRRAFVEANCTQSRGKVILKADCTFPSPSAAAAMVVGGSSNGWTRWVDADGKTLDEVYRGKPAAEKKQITGKTCYSINGKTFNSMSACLREFITLYINKHKDVTYEELRQVFNDSLLERRHRIRGLLFKKEDYDAWTRSDKAQRYVGKPEVLLTSPDGVQFYVNTQWTQASFQNVIEIAKNEGCKITINA